jgi:hypothetical protein
MLNARFKPLDRWTGGERTKDRKAAQFKANYLQTLDLLEYELGKLRADHVVIQIEDPEQHKRIRNDGSMTMADKYWPTKPGVILTFESPKGNISMPCDRYPHWRDNLRAIALSLEALRAVDRYGVTRGNEQYRGWTQIGNGNGKMDRASAFRFIESLRGSPIDRPIQVQALAEIIKTLKVAHHPDKPGGTHETFVAIGQAEEVLCS